MKHLPTISESVVWSMMKSMSIRDTPKVIQEIAETNPVLFGCIKHFADMTAMIHGLSAADNVLTGVAIVCKVLDSQLEADAMNREFV